MDAIREVGLDPNRWAMTRLLIGTTLQAGEEVWLFRTGELAEDANAVIRRFARLAVVVAYRSLYEEDQPEFRCRLASDDLLIEHPVHHDAGPALAEPGSQVGGSGAIPE
jgi:hypothetical protein